MLQEVVRQSSHLEECCRLENIHSYFLAVAEELALDTSSQERISTDPP